MRCSLGQVDQVGSVPFPEGGCLAQLGIWSGQDPVAVVTEERTATISKALHSGKEARQTATNEPFDENKRISHDRGLTVGEDVENRRMHWQRGPFRAAHCTRQRRSVKR